MNPKVSIIIVNWNGREYLEDCLSSVFNQTYDNFNVILVDNGSTDDSIDFVKSNFPKVDIISLKENTGYAKGNNIGIKYALKKHNPDYILLLNNDIKIIRKDTLDKLVKIAETDEKIGIVSCDLVSPDGKGEPLYAKIRPLESHVVEFQEINSFKLYEVDAVIGAVFLIKRKVIDKIGLFDEGFSPFLYEDLDYCVRVKKSGFSILFVPSIKVIHYRSVSIKRVSSVYTSFLSKKNSIRFNMLNSSFFIVIKKIFFDNNPYSLCTCLFEKRNKNAKATLLNIKIRNNLGNILKYFFKAYLVNIRNLKEIMWKRFNRTTKLWY